ncbi:TPA: hypothetical protein ACKE7S_000633 [Acinetobacter baumannii]
MDNYKIKVNDESSADEARDLFKKLGCHPDNSSYEPYVEWVAVFEDGSGSFYSHNMNLNECVEITIAQLRDLVVLKRGDVKDANHRDKRDESIYLTSDKVIYYWQGEWCKSAINKSNDYENYIANSLTPITQPQDPALISGAEALRALIDGHEVQGRLENQVQWTDINPKSDDTLVKSFLTEKNRIGIRCYFRFKPQTIKLELELPKPFEPKVGEEYFYLNSGRESGFAKKLHDGKKLDYMATQFGAWRTEEEIKQVVEQLRKIRGTNS